MMFRLILFFLCLQAQAAWAKESADAVLFSTGAVQARGLSDDDRLRALRLADLLIGEARLDEAEKWVLDRKREDSDEAVWLLRLARIYSGRLDHDAAVKLYQRLLDARGDDPGLLIDLGRHARAAERPDLSRKAFMRARAITPDPVVPFHLAELAFSEEQPLEGRKWAKICLDELGDPIEPEEKRMNLNMRARLRFTEEIHKEFGQLFEEAPEEISTLGEWAEVLMEAGLPRVAEEPLNIMRERFSESEIRWRKYESSRLRMLGDDRAYSEHLQESIDRFPKEGAFVHSLAGLESRRKQWICAQALYLKSRVYPNLRESADTSLLSLRDVAYHHVGPNFYWKESDSARSVETGVAYHGLPFQLFRVEGELSRGRFERKSTQNEETISGGFVSAAMERRIWRSGAIFDYRVSNGRAMFSPGVFGDLDVGERWSFGAQGILGEAWRDSVSALAVGGRRDKFQFAADWQALSRLRLSVRARHHRLSVRNGGKATENRFEPGLSLRVLRSPVYAGLSYRYGESRVSADNAFVSQLSVTPRTQTHYLTLSIGKRWLKGRIRTDAYIYNGHDDERKRRFGNDDLVGYGLNLQWHARRLVWIAKYSNSKEDDETGVAGRSQSVFGQVQWRWGSSAVCNKWRCLDEQPEK